jgi:hypothetical protein
MIQGFKLPPSTLSMPGFFGGVRHESLKPSLQEVNSLRVKLPVLENNPVNLVGTPP